MSSILKRTTISINAELYEAALQRRKTLTPPYKGFSEYVAYLIDKDCREKQKHVMVREESPGYDPRVRPKKGSSAA